MKLLLVDGSNIVMRCAYGGDIPPEQAVPTATRIILRAAEQFGCSHLVAALDCPGTPCWRKDRLPEYKAHRTTDTLPWVKLVFEEWTRIGWWVEAAGGFEADDVIATLALRAVKASEAIHVTILSGDSDVLPLSGGRIMVVKPVNGGQFQEMTDNFICEKYSILKTSQLVDFKAMCGETGDHIPGVPGIGPVRASKLLLEHGSLEAIIEAGKRQMCKYSIAVAQHEKAALLAKELVTLRTDVPIISVTPNGCRIRK